MGAKKGSRVMPEEMREIQRLYNETGNCAEVARRLGRSRSTVARYINLKGVPKMVKHTYQETVRK